MAELTKEIIAYIEDPTTIKVIASKDRHGEVHVVVKDSLFVTEDGQIAYLEYLEGSQTNKNLTYSLWFKQKVAINIITKDNKSFLIKGVPHQALVNGKQFQKYYEKVLKQTPENDLSTVYFIPVDEVTEKTLEIRRAKEEAIHPAYMHLDRLAK